MKVPPFCDYSQYRTWTECPTKWVEMYLRGVQPSRGEGQRDDVLTLGTLVHAGLQTLRETGTIGIPDPVLIAERPTALCMQWALALVAGYHRRYPAEQHRHYYCEAPLRFTLPQLDGEAFGLAKIDSYFHIDAPELMPSGLPDGSSYTLAPGWWIREYKTKDASKNTANYIMQWAVNKQVDFQMHALHEATGEEIQGVIIDVLEKPKVAEPQRMCKACRKKQDFKDYTASGSSFICPACHAVIELDIPEPKPLPTPEYYRIVTTRTASQLEHSLELIQRVRSDMQQASMGLATIDATETTCVHSIFGPCKYFAAHRLGEWAQPSADFVQVEDTIAYTGFKA